MLKSYRMGAKCCGRTLALDTGRVSMMELARCWNSPLGLSRWRWSLLNYKQLLTWSHFVFQKQATETAARNQHRKYKDVRRPVLRYIHLIENVDRRKKYDCKYFSGVRSLHSVVSVSHRDVTLLRVRELACFIKECMDDNSDFCVNKLHVKERRLETLEPKNLTEVCIHVYGFPVVLNYNSLHAVFLFSFVFPEFWVLYKYRLILFFN
jgi:hypothetical protein